MVKPLFKVINPGLYASIQDSGRYGYQQYGVPVSGALDRYAHRMANHILGNHRDAATIEVTILGTTLRVLSNHFIAITGADLKATVDGTQAPLWQGFQVFKDQVIHFEQPLSGARAYIAVAGGIMCQQILGSRSTFARGKIYDLLKKDDVIDVPDGAYKKRTGKLISQWIPTYDQTIELHVIPSHHEEMFEKESVDLFYEQRYTYRSGDRMGCRIQGEHVLSHKKTADIISQCTTFGTIQVPPTGQPIILLADSQTTGGYTTLGTIISSDLWKIAQLLPNGKITFKKIRVD